MRTNVIKIDGEAGDHIWIPNEIKARRELLPGLDVLAVQCRDTITNAY